MLKLMLVNIRNTLVLLVLAYCSVPIISATWSALMPPPTDKRAQLPNYEGSDWAAQHFKEFSELETDYDSYVVWRRKPYAGRTINIDQSEHIRITPAIPGLTGRSIYFFGGSTMWGSGATDATTIPAYYQALARVTAVNYGESGWTAHQSLNELTRLVTEGRRPAVVVFYDGANEVAHKCRRNSDFFSHSNEGLFRDTFRYEPTDAGYYLRSVKTAARNVARKIFGHDSSTAYDCDTDPRKADLVAEALVRDWAIAKFIAESSGARFFAFLQPVAYLSSTRLSHLELDAALGKQFAAVYPLIRAKMRERDIGIDLSATLNHDDYYYIDFCHVSPNGNRVIAESIKTAIADPTKLSSQ